MQKTRNEPRGWAGGLPEKRPQLEAAKHQTYEASPKIPDPIPHETSRSQLPTYLLITVPFVYGIHSECGACMHGRRADEVDS